MGAGAALKHQVSAAQAEAAANRQIAVRAQEMLHQAKGPVGEVIIVS